MLQIFDKKPKVDLSKINSLVDLVNALLNGLNEYIKDNKDRMKQGERRYQDLCQFATTIYQFCGKNLEDIESILAGLSEGLETITNPIQITSEDSLSALRQRLQQLKNNIKTGFGRSTLRDNIEAIIDTDDLWKKTYLNLPVETRRNNSTMRNFKLLPNEVFLLILSFVPAVEIPKVVSLNLAFQRFFQNKDVWETLYKQNVATAAHLPAERSYKSEFFKRIINPSFIQALFKAIIQCINTYANKERSNIKEACVIVKDLYEICKLGNEQYDRDIQAFINGHKLPLLNNLTLNLTATGINSFKSKFGNTINLIAEPRYSTDKMKAALKKIYNDEPRWLAATERAKRELNQWLQQRGCFAVIYDAGWIDDIARKADYGISLNLENFFNTNSQNQLKFAVYATLPVLRFWTKGTYGQLFIVELKGSMQEIKSELGITDENKKYHEGQFISLLADRIVSVWEQKYIRDCVSYDEDKNITIETSQYQLKRLISCKDGIFFGTDPAENPIIEIKFNCDADNKDLIEVNGEAIMAPSLIRRP